MFQSGRSEIVSIIVEDIVFVLTKASATATIDWREDRLRDWDRGIRGGGNSLKNVVEAHVIRL